MCDRTGRLARLLQTLQERGEGPCNCRRRFAPPNWLTLTLLSGRWVAYKMDSFALFFFEWHPHAEQSGAELSPQQTSRPSQVQSRPDHPTHQPVERPTSWQKICRKTRTTCASTVSSKRRTGVRTEPSHLQGRSRSWQPLHSIGLRFRCQRPPSGSVVVLALLISTCACEDNAVRGGCPNARQSTVSALRTVTSTDSCAPWNRGSPLARTSMARSSAAGTATFMSRSLVLHRTNAPASRQMRATVLSGPTARVRNLPDLAHAARCFPSVSRRHPHSQTASVTSSGRRSLSNTRVRKR